MKQCKMFCLYLQIMVNCIAPPAIYNCKWVITKKGHFIVKISRSHLLILASINPRQYQSLKMAFKLNDPDFIQKNEIKSTSLFH